MERKSIVIIAGAVLAVAFGGYVIISNKVVETVVAEPVVEQVAQPLAPTPEPVVEQAVEPVPEVAQIPWRTQPFTVFYSADGAAPVKAGIAVDLAPLSKPAKEVEVLVPPSASNAPTASAPKVRPLSDFLK